MKCEYGSGSCNKKAKYMVLLKGNAENNLYCSDHAKQFHEDNDFIVRKLNFNNSNHSSYDLMHVFAFLFGLGLFAVPWLMDVDIGFKIFLTCAYGLIFINVARVSKE